jgi:hypothetical protein
MLDVPASAVGIPVHHWKGRKGDVTLVRGQIPGCCGSELSIPTNVDSNYQLRGRRIWVEPTSSMC